MREALPMGPMGPMGPARRAFRRSRLHQATQASWPFAVMAAALVVRLLLADDPAQNRLALGWRPAAALVGAIAAGALAYRGGAWGYGLQLGARLALLPFALAFGAQLWQPYCALGQCSAWCARACAGGGIACGAVCAWWMTRPTRLVSVRNGATWASLAVCTTGGGALACHCVGLGSLAALAVGYAATAAAGALTLRRSPPNHA